MKTAIGVLASGGGSTFEACVRATQENDLAYDITTVICDQPPAKAGIYDRVDQLNREYGLHISAFEVVDSTPRSERTERGITDNQSEQMTTTLEQTGVEYVALLGFMQVVRGRLLDRYGYDTQSNIGHILNTHPGLLPESADTYGEGASQRTLDLGLHYSGQTSHLVGPGVDDGPVIGRSFVKIEDGWTAADIFAHVQLAEKASLPFQIDHFIRSQQNQG